MDLTLEQRGDWEMRQEAHLHKGVGTMARTKHRSSDLRRTMSVHDQMTRYVWSLLVIVSLTTAVQAAPRVDVVLGPAAPELERFAADELCEYLVKLFGIHSFPKRNLSPDGTTVFLIGRPETNPKVKQALTKSPFPQVTDQGIVLRRTEYEGRPAMVVGGGSPRATLWAVYELAERWGVRYLVDRDVLPERREGFRIPDLNVLMEPQLRVRAHPTIQDFANSGEAWGMADFRVLIDQLAKMKFNRMNIYPFAYQPYLHYELNGIKRRSAWLWYNFHYPVTGDMVGRELFGSVPEFWNPDLPLKAGYEELVAAGERQVHNLMEHAHRRGMECSVYADLTQFQPEFAPLLKGAQKVRQVGELLVVPGPETAVDDPQYSELCRAVLRATINTYPEADLVTLGMPEWRQWTRVYEDAWRTLDSKYGIGSISSLKDVLDAAEHRKWPRPRGAEKALDEAKGDLASLVFYDRLLHGSEFLQTTLRPDMKFMWWGPAEELWPLLGKLLPRGTEVGVMPDNFQTHLLKRREIFSRFPTQELVGVLDLTLDDDNVGLLPQMTINSVHGLVADLRRSDWAGFVARERFPGDHDWPIAYLAEAAWKADTTPVAVARDMLMALCGEGCVREMLDAWQNVESATATFEGNDYGFTFPVPGMLMKHWKAGPIPAYLGEACSHYQKALDATRGALAKSTPTGRGYLSFWIGRLEFAVGYLKTVEAVRRAAATAAAAGQRQEALTETESAINLLRDALEAYARVARNRTDLGAIAVVNEYGYRSLKAKIADLKG